MINRAVVFLVQCAGDNGGAGAMKDETGLAKLGGQLRAAAGSGLVLDRPERHKTSGILR